MAQGCTFVASAPAWRNPRGPGDIIADIPSWPLKRARPPTGASIKQGSPLRASMPASLPRRPGHPYRRRSRPLPCRSPGETRRRRALRIAGARIPLETSLPVRRSTIPRWSGPAVGELIPLLFMGPGMAQHHRFSATHDFYGPCRCASAEAGRHLPRQPRHQPSPSQHPSRALSPPAPGSACCHPGRRPAGSARTGPGPWPGPPRPGPGSAGPRTRAA